MEAKKEAMNHKSRKAQFYILSAIIIIFILIGLAVVTNYVSVREKPEKFYDIGDALKLEGIRVVEYSEYNNTNVETQIKNYVDLYEQYLTKNPDEKFSFIIIYGSITAGTVKAINYTAQSSGGISLNFGETVTGIKTGTKLSQNQVILNVNPDNTVNVTLTSEENSVLAKVPVFPDNNFAFVLTTSEGFNDYIQASLKTA